MLHKQNVIVRVAASLLLLLAPWPATAQLSGRQTAAGCVSVEGDARVSAEGRLTLQLFPGRPNYESIAAGDEEERTFILELPRAACIDDAGEAADPGEWFVTVHVAVATTSPGLRDVLRASVGRHVFVSGRGFASHTGHHHA